MAAVEDLKRALVNAHNAGDTSAARVLANEIIKLQGEAPKSAASETGAMEAGLIGAGRATDKIVQGVRQAWNYATGDQKTLDSMAADEAEKDRLYKPLKEARPFATSIGEAAPAMAVPLGGGGALATLGKAALGGALPGALSYGDPSERLKSAAVGAAGNTVGAGLGLGLAKFIQPTASKGISQASLDAAERLGVKLSAGQKTGNPAMQGFENYLAKSPGSSGAMQAASGANQTAMNKAAAGAMGQNADDLGEGVFLAAKNAIGDQFQRLQGMTRPQLGDDFFAALAKIDADNAALGSFREKQIDTLIDKSLDLAVKGRLSGEAYKKIRTELSNQASKSFKAGDASVGQAYKTVRAALDDAAEKSLSAADRGAWKTSREQWMAYKALSKSNVAEGGNVSAPRLAAALRQRGDGFRTGAMDGPLADIGRLGESVKGVQNPNSGQLMQQMMYGNPFTGIPLAAGNKAAQSLYTSELMSKYLAEGLVKIGPNGQLIVTKSAMPLGAPLAQSYLGAQ